LRILAPLIAALALAVWGCSSSVGQCSQDAGNDLKGCVPQPDGGSVDCAPTEACAPFLTPGNERCMKLCATNGSCAQGGTICAAVAVGVCNRGDGGDDAGNPACSTDFLCYPNRCPTGSVQ